VPFKAVRMEPLGGKVAFHLERDRIRKWWVEARKTWEKEKRERDQNKLRITPPKYCYPTRKMSFCLLFLLDFETNGLVKDYSIYHFNHRFILPSSGFCVFLTRELPLLVWYHVSIPLRLVLPVYNSPPPQNPILIPQTGCNHSFRRFYLSWLYPCLICGCITASK
jgi:hypothetical protein